MKSAEVQKLVTMIRLKTPQTSRNMAQKVLNSGPEIAPQSKNPAWGFQRTIPGRPKIIMFQGRNLHFRLKNLYLCIKIHHPVVVHVVEIDQ